MYISMCICFCLTHKLKSLIAGDGEVFDHVCRRVQTGGQHVLKTSGVNHGNCQRDRQSLQKAYYTISQKVQIRKTQKKMHFNEKSRQRLWMDSGSLLKNVSRGSGCSISAPCWLRLRDSAGTALWLASVWGMWSTWFIFKLLSSFIQKERRMDEKLTKQCRCAYNAQKKMCKEIHQQSGHCVIHFPSMKVKGDCITKTSNKKEQDLKLYFTPK